MQRADELGRFIKALQGAPLTAQQKKTLRGQAIKGDLDGAWRGYQRLQRAASERRKRKAQ